MLFIITWFFQNLENPSISSLVCISSLGNGGAYVPGKIEAIRQLTDGMPRTLLHFIELLINKPE